VPTFSKKSKNHLKILGGQATWRPRFVHPCPKNKINDNFASFLNLSALVYELQNYKTDEFSHDVFHVPLHGKVQSQSLPEKQAELTSLVLVGKLQANV
jgi:hypothetical protein